VTAPQAGRSAVPPPAERTRFGAVAFTLAGLLFLLYPAVRPWHDETTVGGARESMSSGAWVAAHFFAMLGFIAVPLGLFALNALLRSRLSLLALVAAWVGAGLTLPYYGAEDFGLHALARSRAPDLLGVVDQVRYQPVAIIMFGLGLVLLGAGAVLAAVAIWRSGILPRASGILFAVAFVLFIPQFYLPAAARIGHGILMLAGCLWLATALWRVPGLPRVPAERSAERVADQSRVR
jgi:hypothetical protein